MRLRFLAFALLPLLAVGGCSTLNNAFNAAAGFSVTQNGLDAVKSGYIAGVLTWASGYRDLYDANPCKAGTHATPKNLCAEYPVVLQLQQATTAVDKALKDTQADLDACKVSTGSPQCTGLGAAYHTLTTGIDAVKGIARSFGYAAG